MAQSHKKETFVKDITANCRKSMNAGIQLVKSFSQRNSLNLDLIDPIILQPFKFTDRDATITNSRQYPYDLVYDTAASLWIPLSSLGSYEKELFSNFSNFTRRGYILLDGAKNLADKKYDSSDKLIRAGVLNSLNYQITQDDLGNDDLGEDAFRHAYGTALLVKEFGLAPGLCIMSAHEANAEVLKHNFNFNNVPWDVRVASTMDFYNNFIGATIALQNPSATSEELEILISEAIADGSFLIVYISSDAIHKIDHCTIPGIGPSDYEDEVYASSSCLHSRSKPECKILPAALPEEFYKLHRIGQKVETPKTYGPK
jgi:hypothetical protein